MPFPIVNPLGLIHYTSKISAPSLYWYSSYELPFISKSRQHLLYVPTFLYSNSEMFIRFSLFFASLPLPKCFIHPKHGLYCWPCPARDMSLNSLFPLMVFSSKSVHSSCSHAFYAIFVWLNRSSDIWQNKLLGQGHFPYLLCLFNW